MYEAVLGQDMQQNTAIKFRHFVFRLYHFGGQLYQIDALTR